MSERKVLNIKIRAAQEEDLSLIHSMAMHFQEDHRRLLGWGVEGIDEKLIRQDVIERLSCQDAGYFLAQCEDGVVGYHSWEKRNDFYYTEEVFVEQKFRQQGVAKILIRHFEDWLIAQGQKLAVVSIAPTNRGMLELMRDQGYDTLNMVEVRKNLSDEVRTPNAEQDALGYRWKIYAKD